MSSEPITPAELYTTEFMTIEQQRRLTPDVVLEDLILGNKRFRQRKYTIRNHSEAIRRAAGGQFPKAFVLGCIDSRVPVEDIFDQGMGDIFVGRVAGNIATTDMIGSMEYACQVAGARLILVLGHEQCGAIKGAVEGLRLGSLTQLLEQLGPALERSDRLLYKGDKEAFVHQVAINNVRHSVSVIRSRSTILRELEEEGTIRILGAIYNLSDGTVEFFE
ncbi:carbonic anhydrase family protein [Porphyromonas sp. COT-239 OH1446]|uniref:carbonic anhydrase family protein n=1 Tax=Porphyromonas sp. COT-239 OH1446 TaxID=1515613 RepID=UPI00052BDF12|nr:carbonic anhydrase family protein [Porphyromonas sp. COT-239 OH1446]KGN68485.1 carbonic anhydrase [Porphyromonas sp. COT-239 OH1446]